MKRTIRIGISTCPNDTFAFRGLLDRLIDCRSLDYRFELLDIQQLNDKMLRGELDVAKVSYHAALQLTDRVVALPSGSALGFGVGPLLLAATSNTIPSDSSELTLAPGEHTTANLLFSLFYPRTTRVEQVLFSEIMPSLRNHQADFGVCIHEGRFTWREQGLHLVADLGERWERETNCPLPLGGIVAARSLGNEALSQVQESIQASLRLALADPGGCLPTMRQYAQEFDDKVLMQHVELYVNDWTLDLGAVGKAALQQLNRQAKKVGMLADDAAELEIFRPA